MKNTHNTRRKIFFIFFLICTIFFFSDKNINAASPETQINSKNSNDFEDVTFENKNFKFEQDLFRAKVLKILEEQLQPLDADGAVLRQYQYLRVLPLEGRFVNQELEIFNQSLKINTPFIPIKNNDKVVVYWNNTDYPEFSIESRYHLDKVLIIFATFVLLVLVMTKWKGVKAILSLGLSALFLVYFIAPKLLDGTNILLVSILGPIVILALSIFLSHGFKPVSIIAFLGCTISLILTIMTTYLIIYGMDLKGFGNDDAFWLNAGLPEGLNLQNVLFIGIIISIIGILDDVAIVQASSVNELHTANPNYSFAALYKSSIELGKNHILSMINTLIVIYAGVTLPIILRIFYLNDWGLPLWARLNYDSIVEEIIRALTGSAVLIITVPITTLIAAYYYNKQRIINEQKKLA